MLPKFFSADSNTTNVKSNIKTVIFIKKTIFFKLHDIYKTVNLITRLR